MKSLHPRANAMALNAWCYRGWPSHSRSRTAACFARLARRIDRHAPDEVFEAVGADEMLPLTGQDAQDAFDAAEADRRDMASAKCFCSICSADDLHECGPDPFAQEYLRDEEWMGEGMTYTAALLDAYLDTDSDTDHAEDFESELLWGTEFDPADLQWGFSIVSTVHTPSDRVRVYDLARELGLSCHNVLDAMWAQGIAVRSHSSTIEPAQADRVRHLVARIAA